MGGQLAHAAAGTRLDDVEDPPPGGVAEGVEDRRHVVHDSHLVGGCGEVGICPGCVNM